MSIENQLMIKLHARNVVVHEHLDALSEAVAQRVASLAVQRIATHGVFSLAVAGGETPRRCYSKLCQYDIDWARVQIYFGDERCLPQGDLQRNDSMVRDALITRVGIPLANVHSIPAELGPEQAAKIYSALLHDVMPLDLVLLGMGEDGHTASLFPNNSALRNTDSVVPVWNAPKPPAERVSMGLNALNTACQKIFLVAGAGKRAALEQILHGDLLPAARVSDAEWHLDHAALPEGVSASLV